MGTPNYLEILIAGYGERGSYFKDYLIGQIKEFEKIHISKIEFIERLEIEIDKCFSRIYELYEKDLKSYNEDILKKKKDRYGYPKPYKYKEEIKNEKYPNIICLHSTLLTNGQVKKPEYLYLSDFEQMKNIIIELRDNNNELKEYKNLNKTETTHKTQILLLEKLGFFELDMVHSLSTDKKGLLVSLLLNRNVDNSIDYIGNKYEKGGDFGSKKSPYNNQSVEQLDRLLTQLNLVK
jgi:hypothetical protein